MTSQEQGGEGREEVEGEGRERIMELLWRSYPGVEPGGGRRLPGVHYHTSGNEGGVLRLSRIVTFSEEDGEEEQPLAPDRATFSSS